MALSDWIKIDHNYKSATATHATHATDKLKSVENVATVATVAVADKKSSKVSKVYTVGTKGKGTINYHSMIDRSGDSIEQVRQSLSEQFGERFVSVELK